MYTLRDYTKTAEDFEAALRRVAEIGLEVLQLTPPAFLGTEATAKLLAEYSLRADSVFAPTGGIVDKVDEIRRDAELLGCDAVRTDSIPNELRADRDGYRRFAERMNSEGRALRAVGLRYIYHFHAFEWISFGDVRGIDILLNCLLYTSDAADD